VKIGFIFQSLGKISNISAADPPVLLGQFQHWLSTKNFAPLGTSSKFNRFYASQWTYRENCIPFRTHLFELSCAQTNDRTDE